MSRNRSFPVERKSFSRGPFRITGPSWLVFAIHGSFCVIWPALNNYPVFSLVWGLFLMGGFVAAAVGLTLGRLVYRFGGQSNAVANFIFCFVISAAFAVTVFAMVKQDETLKTAGQRLMTGMAVPGRMEGFTENEPGG